MDLFGTTRSRLQRTHALFTPESFVRSDLPGWERSQVVFPPSCAIPRSIWLVPQQAGKLIFSEDYAERPQHHVTKNKPQRRIKRVQE